MKLRRDFSSPPIGSFNFVRIKAIRKIYICKIGTIRKYSI